MFECTSSTVSENTLLVSRICITPLTLQPYIVHKTDNSTRVKSDDLSMLHHSWISVKMVRFL